MARLKQLPAGLARKTVLKERFSVVLPKDHPLEAATFKNVGQLSEEQFILFRSDYSTDYYDKVTSICKDQGFMPKVSHRTVHASTIFRLVENGLGISIIPSSLIHGYNMKVKALEIKKIPQKAVLSMIWKKDNNNPVLQNFLGVVNE